MTYDHFLPKFLHHKLGFLEYAALNHLTAQDIGVLGCWTLITKQGPEGLLLNKGE